MVAIGCLLVTAVALSIWHLKQVRAAQRTSADALFKRLDTPHKQIQTMDRQFMIYFKALERDNDAAAKAMNKRHDDYDSLSGQEIQGLARTELKDVKALQATQAQMDDLDQQELAIYAALYGEQTVGKLRTDMAERNEVRENGYDMWWRAAQSINDNIKDSMNGIDASNSIDEIARDYDESDKDLNHAAQLQLAVDREAYAIDRRLALEWQSAKRILVALGGS
jgi:hypothetical protein